MHCTSEPHLVTYRVTEQSTKLQLIMGKHSIEKTAGYNLTPVCRWDRGVWEWRQGGDRGSVMGRGLAIKEVRGVPYPPIYSLSAHLPKINSAC